MVDKEPIVKQELIKYKEIVNNQKKKQTALEVKSDSTEPDEVILDSAVLFFSYDIVNSSAYKTINYYGWSIVLHEIIRKLRDKVKEKITRAEVWRVFGDEVVFIVTICDNDSVFEYIDSIYDILISFCNSMDDGKFFEEISGLSLQSVGLMKLQNVVSLQATAWIAAVTDRKRISELHEPICAENIYEVFEENRNNRFYEFIGQDIDAGFRISEQTREKRLALSFELACILSHQKQYTKRLHIVTFRSLKGVWGGNLYPIIWYYDQEKNDNQKFIRSFPFDAVEKDEIYKEFFGKKIFPEYMYRDTKSALKKILSDRKMQYKIDHITKIIEVNNRTESFLNDSRLELHCVAVCFDHDNKVLVAKRYNRKYLDNCWECGCAQANAKKTLIESLQNEYNKDFGIVIEPIVYEDRIDKEPVPVAMYKIEKEEELHKGVIVLAKILQGKVVIDKGKHSEYRMITEDEVESLDKEECVPDLKNTLKLAFSRYKEWGNIK